MVGAASAVNVATGTRGISTEKFSAPLMKAYGFECVFPVPQSE
jgi:hypothetical protein